MTFYRRVDAERGSRLLRDAILRSMCLAPPKRPRKTPVCTSPKFWTEEELRKLASLADARVGSGAIATILGRSMGAVRAKAFRKGISLDKYKVRPRPRPADTSQWSEADRLSEWAGVPQELAEMVVQMAGRTPVTEIRSQSRRQDLVERRWEIAVAARAKGYSLPSIGRALNRDHTTILHALRQSKSPFSTGRSPSVPCEQQGIIAA